MWGALRGGQKGGCEALGGLKETFGGACPLPKRNFERSQEPWLAKGLNEIMAKAVFVHRADSIYDDFPEAQYQFPKQYLKRVAQTEGDWIVYYEPRGGGGRLGYNAIAMVSSVEPDPQVSGMFIARIKPGSYLPLDTFVPYKAEDGYLESKLNNEDGSLNNGHTRSAVRLISDNDFYRILQRGFQNEQVILPREKKEDRPAFAGFAEAQSGFEYDFERPRIEQTLTRAVRDRVFRKHVLEAYESRCAFTGLKFTNGGGRAEVQAAHIQAVEHDGPDTVRNGLALSGTVHWMFDRGLISLSDDGDILVSRKVNNPDEVWRLMNPSKRVRFPIGSSNRPHPRFTSWHREFHQFN